MGNYTYKSLPKCNGEQCRILIAVEVQQIHMDWTLDCEHGTIIGQATRHPFLCYPKNNARATMPVVAPIQWSCGSDDVERKRGIAPELEIGQRDGWMRTCGVRNKYFHKDW